MRLTTATTILLAGCALLAVAGSKQPTPTPTATPNPSPTPSTGEPEGGYKNTLRWTTASEVDNFGFDIYRATAAEGPFERVTREPIPGAGTVDEPQSYVFVDHEIDPTQGYYYYIESISINGVRERFSPVTYVAPKKPAATPSSAAAPQETPAGG